MSVRCYAQRLLNPFRGAMHVVEFGAAEAVTTDGVHWDIYVAMEDLLDGLYGIARVQISDIRYGSWSADKGLKRGPLYPSDDFRRLEEMGATVYQHLLRAHREIPFPFLDRFELWLLDTAGAPLALLHSVVDEEDVAPEPPLAWRAGLAARERFSSPAMGRLLGVDARFTSAADYLAACVNARAGDPPVAQWFARQADGSGRGLQCIGAAAGEGRTLTRDAFPPLLLAAFGHDDLHRQLIEDFHTWQAPWLLVLSHLDAATRRAIEQRARRQALAIYDQHRLYPETMDRQTIQSALVEAVLRRSQPHLEARADENPSPFYIELNPAGPE